MVRKAIRIAIVTSIHNDYDHRIWKHAISLSRKGHVVHLISPWKICSTDMELDVRLHCFKRATSRWQRPWKIPFLMFRELIPLMPDVDVVHFHDIDILPWMAAVSFFKPVVYDVHENYPDEMMDRSWIPNSMRRMLYHLIRHTQFFLSRFIKNIVLVAPAQHKDFNHKKFNKILVYNYASLDLIEKRKNDYLEREDIVLFTGAHYISNGTMLILDIAERMREKYPRLKFLMTDRFSAEFRKFFEKEIKDRYLDGVICIIPQVKSDDIMELLNKATIGLCPNLRVTKQLIAIPTKIFEYMAAGLPVVASNFGAQKRIITAANSGILADPGNPESFVHSIEKLINHRHFAKALGENGLNAFTNKYNWERQISGLESYYESVVSHQGLQI